jgi:predicted membrane protein
MTFPGDASVSPRPRLTAQVMLGFLIILVGVLFTLDNLEIIDARDYIQYWPAGLVAVGLVKLRHAVKTGQGWFGGLVLTVIGLYMLIARIVYFTIDASALMPMILVFLGGYMVWRGFGGRRRASPRASDGQSQFSAFAVMGGISRRSNSQNFQGADLTAVMGGCEIDLRQASIVPGTEAVIDVFAFWGGIELKVPDDWTVVPRVLPLMGGVDDKSRAPVSLQDKPPAEKRLVVRGVVVMGGVGIKNAPPRTSGRED